MFGPVDLGAPAVCAEYLSAHGGCAISSAMGVAGVLLIGAALGVAVGGCVARACGPNDDANAYETIEMGRLG